MFNLNNLVNVILVILLVIVMIIDDEFNVCGVFVYDLFVEKVLFVWRDCDMGEWYVWVLVGGDFVGVFYEG